MVKEQNRWKQDRWTPTVHSWALPWTLSWDVLWEFFRGESSRGWNIGKSTLVGSLVGALVGGLVGPLVGQISLSPALRVVDLKPMNGPLSFKNGLSAPLSLGLGAYGLGTFKVRSLRVPGERRGCNPQKVSCGTALQGLLATRTTRVVIPLGWYRPISGFRPEMGKKWTKNGFRAHRGNGRRNRQKNGKSCFKMGPKWGFRPIFPIFRPFFSHAFPRSAEIHFSSIFWAGGPKWVCTSPTGSQDYTAHASEGLLLRTPSENPLSL